MVTCRFLPSNDESAEANGDRFELGCAGAAGGGEQRMLPVPAQACSAHCLMRACHVPEQRATFSRRQRCKEEAS